MDSIIFLQMFSLLMYYFWFLIFVETKDIKSIFSDFFLTA